MRRRFARILLIPCCCFALGLAAEDGGGDPDPVPVPAPTADDGADGADGEEDGGNGEGGTGAGGDEAAAPAFERTTIANEHAIVELTSERGALARFRLEGHFPIEIPEHYRVPGRQADPDKPLAVLAPFNQQGSNHNWLAGMELDDAPRAWKLIERTATTATFAAEHPDKGLFYELRYELAADRAEVFCKLRVRNVGERTFGWQPVLYPINGVHQDVGRNEAYYCVVAWHREEDLDTAGFPEPKTQETLEEATDADYVAVKSRFFAALWKPRGIRVVGDGAGETEAPPEEDEGPGGGPGGGPVSSGGGPGGPQEGSTTEGESGYHYRAVAHGFTGNMPKSNGEERGTSPNPLYQTFLDIRWFGPGDGHTVEVAPGETLEMEWSLLVSSMAKDDLEALDEAEARIEYTDAFHKFFKILSNLLTWVLNLLAGIPLVGYGLAVILLTLLVKGALHRVTYKQQESMLKMSKLMPEMKRIQEQYKNDRQTAAAKQFELYRKHGVNPMGGCLPILIQMPIFVALYQAFSHSADMRGESFLWLHDLTLPDQLFQFFEWTWPFFGGPMTLNPLPLVYIGVSLFMHRLYKPTTQVDPNSQQAQMMKMMRWLPVVFGVIFYNMPSGLVLYFTCSAIITAAEMKYIRWRLGM